MCDSEPFSTEGSLSLSALKQTKIDNLLPHPHNTLCSMPHAYFKGKENSSSMNNNHNAMGSIKEILEMQRAVIFY